MLRTSIAVTFLLASACTTTPHISNKSIAYNDAVEMDSNVGVLKNAVRASLRLPVEYTRLGSLTFTGDVSGGAKTEIKLGDGRPGGVPLSLNIGGDETAKIAFERLTGEEFYAAISEGIKLVELAEYWEEGWPRDFLLMLLVERIEMAQFLFCDIKTKDDRLSDQLKVAFEKLRTGTKCADDDPKKSLQRIVVDNDPDNAEGFFGFVSLVRHLTQPGIVKTSSVPSDNYLTPALPEKMLSDPKFILAIMKEKLQIEEQGGGKFKLYRTATSSRLSFDESLLFSNLAAASKKKRKLEAGEDKTFAECKIDTVSFSSSGSLSGCVTIVMRSPDAVVYYLGEILRSQTDPDSIASYVEFCRQVADENGGCVMPATDKFAMRLHERGVSFGTAFPSDLKSVLFYLNSSSDGISPFDRRRSGLGIFEFRYLGKRYAVPDESKARGRTMQGVSLVKRLIGRRQNAPEILQSNSFIIEDFGIR